MAQTYSEHLEQGIRTAQNKFIDFVYKPAAGKPTILMVG